jgi:hypothetical protein
MQSRSSQTNPNGLKLQTRQCNVGIWPALADDCDSPRMLNNSWLSPAWAAVVLIAVFVTADDGVQLAVWIPIVVVTAVLVLADVRAKRRAH